MFKSYYSLFYITLLAAAVLCVLPGVSRAATLKSTYTARSLPPPPKAVTQPRSGSHARHGARTAHVRRKSSSDSHFHLGTVGIEVNGLSYHFNRQAVRNQNLHEFNPGLGISYKQGHFIGTVGLYRNSYGKRTNYALAGAIWPIFGPLRLGLVVGAVSGYKRDTGMDWTPAIAPLVRLWRFNVLLTPWFAGVSYTLIHF